MPQQVTEVEGVPVRFVRRRYGRSTYTWVEAQISGEWTSLGDPWPSMNVPLDALRQAVAVAVEDAKRARKAFTS